MGEMSAQMMFEEIEIAIGSGRCPRCGVPLVCDISDDEWMMTCPGCKAVYGGSL